MSRIKHKFDLGDPVRVMKTDRIGYIAEIKARSTCVGDHAVLDPRGGISYRITGSREYFLEKYLYLLKPKPHDT